jgi:enamine deaminase RidA (YjgF/YER057c/UK114 family)
LLCQTTTGAGHCELRLRKATFVGRVFVPFGRKWVMGIDVPYSLAVIENGSLYSCGQCPLDLSASVVHARHLAPQLALLACYLKEEFSPFGVPPWRLSKLVAYVANDDTFPIEGVAPRLRSALATTTPVTVIGVPPFYYPGMMVEIDVHGCVDAEPRQFRGSVAPGIVAEGSVAGRAVHVRLDVAPFAVTAGLADALDRFLAAHGARVTILSVRVFVADAYAGGPLPGGLSAAMAGDPGAAVVVRAPQGVAAAIDIIAESGTSELLPSIIVDQDGVRLVIRRGDGVVGLLARCLGRQGGLAYATEAVMAILAAALERYGFTFADVVKQQTYYVGGATADDLYVNMRIRNHRYGKPGPASTGLAVYGFSDHDCAITVELLAERRT